MIRIHTERNNSQEAGKIKMQNAKDISLFIWDKNFPLKKSGEGSR